MENQPPAIKKDRFTLHQKKTLLLCFLAYVFTYTVRVNISVALPALAAQTGMTATTSGLISGSFLWCYAIGQLVFGRLGDLLSGKIMIFTGLCGSALCNLTFGLVSNHAAMIFIWAVNGIFQSMIWSPIVHTLSVNFRGKLLVKATAFMPFAIVLGYMLAWGLSSVFSMYFPWRVIFIVPAAAVLVFVTVFLLTFKEIKKEKKANTNGEIKKTEYQSIRSNKFVIIVILLTLACAITHGMIRESINYWFPTLLSSLKNISPWVSVGILLIVPVINFFGTLVSRELIKKTKNNIFRDIMLLSGAAVIFAVIAAATQPFGDIPLIIFTVILLGTMFGITPLFTSFMPLHYAKYNMVGTMAGMMDAFIYFGAAFSTMLTGSLVESNGWLAVCIYWSVTAAASFGLTILCYHIKKKTDLKI